MIVMETRRGWGIGGWDEAIRVFGFWIIGGIWMGVGKWGSTIGWSGWNGSMAFFGELLGSWTVTSTDLFLRFWFSNLVFVASYFLSLQWMRNFS
jgi:hypothetical protein